MDTLIVRVASDVGRMHADPMKTWFKIEALLQPQLTRNASS